MPYNFVDIPWGMTAMMVKNTGLPVRIRENLGEFNRSEGPLIVDAMVKKRVRKSYSF